MWDCPASFTAWSRRLPCHCGPRRHGTLLRSTVSFAILLPVMLIFLAGKLLWEAAAGPLPMTAELAGGDVVVGAHLWGTLGGGLTALMLAALRRSGPPL